MKKKIMIVFGIVITIGILSFSYLLYIQKLIINNTTKNLEELTKQDAAKIENKLKQDITILDNICNEIINNNLKNKEEWFQIYNTNSAKNNFTRMAVMYQDGTTITSDEEVVDLSEEVDYFFSSENAKISRSRKSKVDMQEINIYSKKINISNTPVVIMLIVETQAYERLFANSIYNGRVYEYIITEKGEIIVNSANQENTKNIYTGLKENIDETIKINKGKIDELQNDIKNQKNGQRIVKINNRKYYISYVNISINDWNLLIIAPENIIAKELLQVLKISLLVAAMIILSIIIVVSYIIALNIKKKKELYNLAYIDPITKQGNYYYFIENGQILLDNYTNNNKYIIILDIEKFKSFNSHYGHKVGNKLLVQISKKLNEIMEEYNKIICRLSNDIFGIVIETKKDIKNIAEITYNHLSRILIETETYSIYTVIGIYHCKKNDEILQAIDKATIAHDIIIGNYNKKYCIFDEGMEKQILEEHHIEEIMYEALKNKEFEIYYQPKINIKSEKVVSAEALVRWIRNGEVISPNKFIPLFEKNRFILKLDMYIYEQVCKDLLEWKGKKEFDFNVSINVSKEHFNEIDFIDKYEKIAKKYSISTNKIDLEITESASADIGTNFIEVMKKIKEKNFIVSLDDFGTGYSSLNMLQDMPIDIIKIDKTFIDKIGKVDEKIDLIKYIIQMAKELNIKTVAEGVESKNQVEYLTNAGCDIIQGYYYSKPLSKKEFEEYIKKVYKEAN